MERPALRALADRMRIQASYVDQTGAKLRHTSDATRVRLLAAMGIDASTEELAQAALKDLRRAESYMSEHPEWRPHRVVS